MTYRRDNYNKIWEWYTEIQTKRIILDGENSVLEYLENWFKDKNSVSDRPQQKVPDCPF